MRVIPVEVLENFLNNFNKYYIKNLKNGKRIVMSRENIVYLLTKFINKYSFEIKEE